MAYYLLQQGHPKTDFVWLVDLLSKAGCDVRDINNSFNFVDKWGSVCEVKTNDRLKRFFSTRREQTGQKHYCKVLADSATWQHRTRQVIGVVTVVPDAYDLIHAFF